MPSSSRAMKRILRKEKDPRDAWMRFFPSDVLSYLCPALTYIRERPVARARWKVVGVGPTRLGGAFNSHAVTTESINCVPIRLSPVHIYIFLPSFSSLILASPVIIHIWMVYFSSQTKFWNFYFISELCSGSGFLLQFIESNSQ